MFGVAFGGRAVRCVVPSVVESHPQRLADHMLLCDQRRHAPRHGVLQGDQSTQVAAEAGVVPGTGPQQPQAAAPAVLPQVDEERVGQQPQRQPAAPGQQPGPEALHRVDRTAVHGESPQAGVAHQSGVSGGAPVPGGGEGHLAEAAVQRVHIEAGGSREAATRGLPAGLILGLVLGSRPCYTQAEKLLLLLLLLRNNLFRTFQIFYF